MHVASAQGLRISNGKVIVMSTVNDEKFVNTSDSTIDKKPPTKPFEGQVVSLSAGKLIMRNKDGKQYSHTLAPDAMLTCDGNVCKAEDLKAGSKIRVTTKEGARNVATCIESLEKNEKFAQCG
jgi:hypothetical protein